MVDTAKFNVRLHFILAQAHYKIYLRERNIEHAEVSFVHYIGFPGLHTLYLVVEMHSRISIVIALCIGLTYAEPVPSMCMLSLLVNMCSSSQRHDYLSR